MTPTNLDQYLDLVEGEVTMDLMPTKDTAIESFKNQMAKLAHKDPLRNTYCMCADASIDRCHSMSARSKCLLKSRA